MFNVNDYVMYGNIGICKIEEISKLDFGKEGIYYTLQPVYADNSKIYVAVDNTKVNMRSAISKEEAVDIINGKKRCEEPVWVPNNKAREAMYKNLLKTGNCLQWYEMTKELTNKKREKQEEGKNLLQADESAFVAVKKLLYGELAVVLDLTIDEVNETVLS